MEASDSEHETEVNREDDGENVVKTDVPVAKSVVRRKRRKDTHFQGAYDNIIL